MTATDGARALAAERWPERDWDDLTQHSRDECVRFARAVASAHPLTALREVHDAILWGPNPGPVADEPDDYRRGFNDAMGYASSLFPDDAQPPTTPNGASS